MIEAKLIEQAQRGSDAAWAEVMRTHQQAVFRLAYLHLGDAAEAEDAAQDCFIRAYRGLQRFDTSRPLRPWLLRIVSNLALNRRRSLGRYWGALQRAARDEPLAAAAPDAGQETASETQELWSAIKRLPAQMQTVLYLRYFLEMTVAETAQTLDVAEGTVKSQTSRALANLQAIIRKHYPSLEEEWG